MIGSTSSAYVPGSKKRTRVQQFEDYTSTNNSSTVAAAAALPPVIPPEYDVPNPESVANGQLLPMLLGHEQEQQLMFMSDITDGNGSDISECSLGADMLTLVLQCIAQNQCYTICAPDVLKLPVHQAVLRSRCNTRHLDTSEPTGRLVIDDSKATCKALQLYMSALRARSTTSLKRRTSGPIDSPIRKPLSTCALHYKRPPTRCHYYAQLGS
eukprot:21054-Heterococcus_DN1.PRE.2